MKDTDFRSPETEKIEIVSQAKKDIQKILIGNINPKKNHILFEANHKEKTITRAKYNRNLTITFSDAMQQKKENKSVSVKNDCIYISALNVKNAIKILRRDYNLTDFKALKT